MDCRNCGAIVEKNDKYCSACGKEIELDDSTAKGGEQLKDNDRYTSNDEVNTQNSIIQSSTFLIGEYSNRAAITFLGGILIVFHIFFTFQQANTLGFQIQRTGIDVGFDPFSAVVLGILILILARYRWNTRTASLCVVFSLFTLLLFFYYLGAYNFTDPETRVFVNPGFGLYLLGFGSFLVVISSSHKVILGYLRYIRDYNKQYVQDFNE